MAQFLQTNGDYTVKTAEGGIIKLDVGPPTAGGSVIITSNLVVEGESLTVESENLNIRDNVIRVNFGETGAGVSLRYAGVQVDRGTELASSFFYDENDNTWNIANRDAAGVGAFDYTESTLRLSKIVTNGASTDLILLGDTNPDGVLTVIGTTTYEDNVTHDDDIPNKKYVDDSIRDNPTFQIIEQDTRVIITDSSQSDPLSGSLSYLTSNTSALGTDDTNSSAVSILVDNALIAQFFSNRLEVGTLEIGTDDLNTGDARITSKNAITNANIKIETQGTGRLVTNYAFQMEKIAGDPAHVNNSVTVYSKNPDIGKTGVFFSHSEGTGEMISKNKALLLSMIF